MLSWNKEEAPRWDADKKRIVGDTPKGVFDVRYAELADGDVVPGEWWRVEDDGSVVGFGWLDIVWGDAEILLATAADAQGKGVGSFTLSELDREARARGVNYLYNVVRPTHPDGPRVAAWLEKRGFEGSEDGSLRRKVSA